MSGDKNDGGVDFIMRRGDMYTSCEHVPHVPETARVHLFRLGSVNAVIEGVPFRFPVLWVSCCAACYMAAEGDVKRVCFAFYPQAYDGPDLDAGAADLPKN